MRTIFALAGLLITMPAQADWQYTRWGMTPDEVMAASGPTAVRGDWPDQSSKQERALVANYYRSMDLLFSVIFRFSRTTGGLTEVELSNDKTNECIAAKQKLRSSYGEPQKKVPRDPAQRNEYDELLDGDRWVDPMHGNEILFMRIGTLPQHECFIRYTRLPVAGERGGL